MNLENSVCYDKPIVRNESKKEYSELADSPAPLFLNYTCAPEKKVEVTKNLNDATAENTQPASESPAFDHIFKAVELKIKDKFKLLEEQSQRASQLQQRLNYLKGKYSKEYSFIDEVMDKETTEYEGYVLCTWDSLHKRRTYGISVFENKFAPEEWTLQANGKSDTIDKKSFFMNNIIAEQFEKSFAIKGWPLQLPKTIKRLNIVNDDTDKLIQSYKGRHDSDDFMQDFLKNTVNGKSTVRIAEDFDLEIYKLSVEAGKIKTAPIIHSLINPQIPDRFYSVTVHVRPRS